ncbi:hypothetical protein QQF64_004193 [Cirrhinus molitorella]|uniref:Uncharacterized protein n=1 Tax=Cirrhinus molitorella TaxID=172907 RepID=A0ABR3MJF2_9TELE
MKKELQATEAGRRLARAREDLFISHHSSVDGAGEQTGGQEVRETAKKWNAGRRGEPPTTPQDSRARMSSERYASFGQDKLNIKPSERTVALSLVDSRSARGQKTHQRHEISNRTVSLWCSELFLSFCASTARDVTPGNRAKSGPRTESRLLDGPSKLAAVRSFNTYKPQIQQPSDAAEPKAWPVRASWFQTKAFTTWSDPPLRFYFQIRWLLRLVKFPRAWQNERDFDLTPHFNDTVDLFLSKSCWVIPVSTANLQSSVRHDDVSELHSGPPLT